LQTLVLQVSRATMSEHQLLLWKEIEDELNEITGIDEPGMSATVARRYHEGSSSFEQYDADENLGRKYRYYIINP
jgi:hypothetical protein